MNVYNIVTSLGVKSDLVYPLGLGYFYIAKLDKKWVEAKLRQQFNVDRIENKYCIKLAVRNGNMLVTNHDGEFWLTKKED